MGLEPRGRAVQGRPMANPSGEEPGEGPKRKVKSFEIRKRLVYEAWQRVQANGGAPGVDTVSIEGFADDEANNLYKLWNRMSSGSYFPGPVRAVEIPKDHGQGVRVLGVPNTADRVAQTAAAMLLEERLEPIFHPDSSHVDARRDPRGTGEGNPPRFSDLTAARQPLHALRVRSLDGPGAPWLTLRALCG